LPLFLVVHIPPPSKLLLLYSSQFGIYIMPQLDTLEGTHRFYILVWHGVLFVRYGLYKDAKLKFKITFEQFPRKPPQVMFVSDVYHPMVDS
jgi:ubiquitin-protein ligase